LNDLPVFAGLYKPISVVFNQVGLAVGGNNDPNWFFSEIFYTDELSQSIGQRVPVGIRNKRVAEHLG